MFGFHLLHIFTIVLAIGTLFVFFGHSSICKVVSHCDLDFQLSMTNDIETLRVLIWHSHISFVDLSKIFVCFICSFYVQFIYFNTCFLIILIVIYIFEYITYSASKCFS